MRISSLIATLFMDYLGLFLYSDFKVIITTRIRLIKVNKNNINPSKGPLKAYKRMY